MKKKYLTFAGIISALILVGMFIVICLSQIPFPFLSPAATIDPITDTNIDRNNIMILTGTTTLPPEYTLLFLTVNATQPFLSQGVTATTPDTRGDAYLIGEAHHWKGMINISSLQPADYTVTLWKFTVDENFRMNESHPVATQQFKLSAANAGDGSVRKKPLRDPLPFIRINPIDQELAAENREISGITSLAPGTILSWSVLTVNDGTGNGTQEYQGTTPVFSGIQGVNRWSVLTGAGTLKPARYRFNISGMPGGEPSSVTPLSAISEFVMPVTLKNTTEIRPVSRNYITIDSFPEIRTNDRYTITGSTSLPAGDALLFQITPASFVSDYNFTFDPRGNQVADFSGITGMTDVVKGNGGNNLWAVDFTTYNLVPGRYIVNVSNDRYEFAGNAIVYGGVFSSRIFPVTGDPP